MNREQLFDLFVAHGTTREEIAKMNINTITRHIAEMRRDEPDDILLTDEQIAEKILSYARK